MNPITLDDLRVHHEPCEPDCHGRRSVTLADLRSLLVGLGAEELEAWLSEDPEFGEDLWTLPVERKGVYLVIPVSVLESAVNTLEDEK